MHLKSEAIYTILAFKAGGFLFLKSFSIHLLTFVQFWISCLCWAVSMKITIGNSKFKADGANKGYIKFGEITRFNTMI